MCITLLITMWKTMGYPQPVFDNLKIVDIHKFSNTI